MSKLLRSGVRRYAHSIIFWLAVVVTVGAAVVCGYEARHLYFEDFYLTIALIANAVMISWLVGREYMEGSFRNKVVSGHTKGKIFLSELILGVATCVVLYLLFVLIFFCFNSYIIGYAPICISLKVFAGGFLTSACTAAILVTMSVLIPRRAIVAIVNILLIFVMVVVTNNLHNKLSEPEYWEMNKYDSIQCVDEEGNVYYTLVPIEGSKQPVKNERYIDSPLRDVLQLVYRISPYTPIREGDSVTDGWLGYNQQVSSRDFGTSHLIWDHNADFTVTDEENQNLNISLIYSAVEFVVVCGIGYLYFRKKDLK